MNVIRTTKKDVLNAIKTELKSGIPEMKERIFISGDESIPENLRDHQYITITPHGGAFKTSFAGRYIVPYEGNISVIVWWTDRRDRAGSDESMLTSDSSILDMQKKVLKTLIGSHLMKDSDPQQLRLTESLAPLSDSDLIKHDAVFGGQPRSGTAMSALATDFKVSFHWDLEQ